MASSTRYTQSTTNKRLSKWRIPAIAALALAAVVAAGIIIWGGDVEKTPVQTTVQPQAQHKESVTENISGREPAPDPVPQPVKIVKAQQETLVMQPQVGTGENPPLVDPQAELASVLTELFMTEAMETLPLLSLHTADPLQPEKKGPQKGELWIRINPANSYETRDIMAQVADLYRTTVRYEEPVTVMLWVGGQPMARFEY